MELVFKVMPLTGNTDVVVLFGRRSVVDEELDKPDAMEFVEMTDATIVDGVIVKL